MPKLPTFSEITGFNPFSWTCPFCSREQTVTQAQFSSTTQPLKLALTKQGLTGFTLTAIACSNKECGEVQIVVAFAPGKMINSNMAPARFEHNGKPEVYRVRPTAFYKRQPDCVPEPLRNDYYEACAIRDTSPKSSATLSRRILQGAIRNFCTIKKRNLADEIDALKALADAGNAPQGVDHQTIDAMHHVRSIGNIGAHMEADINVVVDVEPNEAQLLIELVEMIFKEWYIARHERNERLTHLKAVADKKAVERKAPPKPSA